MTRWIDNSIADRLYILDHVSSLKDITPESVEKDWWVTAVLQCVFELTAAPYMYFKGGTSLSKGWRLIDRFSEDIDIALYRDFFLNELHRSCAACETNNQIMNLRKVSRDYVTTVLKAELEERLTTATPPCSMSTTRVSSARPTNTSVPWSRSKSAAFP